MRPGRIVDVVVAGRRARELLSHDGWTVDQLRTHQQARLDELVRYAVARSAYYRSLYIGVDLSGPVALEQLPPVGKEAIMRHFDDVLTDPRRRLDDVAALLGPWGTTTCTWAASGCSAPREAPADEGSS
ncbi:MAG TPA: hypothetical protein VGJ44_11555, partial [Kribbellaceae bacterium]